MTFILPSFGLGALFLWAAAGGGRGAAARLFLGLVFTQFGVVAVVSHYSGRAPARPAPPTLILIKPVPPLIGREKHEEEPSEGRVDGGKYVREIDDATPGTGVPRILPIILPPEKTELKVVGFDEPQPRNDAPRVVSPPDDTPQPEQRPQLLPPGPGETAPKPTIAPPAIQNQDRPWFVVSGDKVVFVLDASGSMFPDRFPRLEKELNAVIASLPDSTRFQVIFFDDKIKRFLGDGGNPDNKEPKWYRKSAKAVAEAKELIAKVDKEGGGTVPQPALTMALKLEPVQVIFLSDGEFNVDVDKLAEANVNGASIDCTLIGDDENRSAAKNMQDIKTKFGGSYQYHHVK